MFYNTKKILNRQHFTFCKAYLNSLLKGFLKYNKKVVKQLIKLRKCIIESSLTKKSYMIER